MGRCRISKKSKKSKSQPLIEIGVNGNMLQLESKLSQDFRIIDTYEDSRGVFYQEDNTSYVLASHHESLGELMDTCSHEAIHYAIRNSLNDDLDESISMPVEKEHKLMNFIMWANEAIHEQSLPPLQGKPLYDEEE